MRYTIVILFLLLEFRLFSQTMVNEKMPSQFEDTALVTVTLLKTGQSDDKILMVRFGDADIYFSKAALHEATRPCLPDSFTQEESKAIVAYLDSGFLKADTVYGRGKLPDNLFSRLVSEELKLGKAKVYDRKNLCFVRSVFHRLERVISQAHRRFYFADKRLAYSSTEWSGILPNELLPDIE